MNEHLDTVKIECSRVALEDLINLLNEQEILVEKGGVLFALGFSIDEYRPGFATLEISQTLLRTLV